MVQIIIYTVAIVIFGILIKWTLHNLSALGNKEKAIYLIIGILAVSIFSLVIFNISKASVSYPSNEVGKQIEKMLLSLFIPINGLIILPYVANLIEKFKLEDIEENALKKKIVIFLVILIIVVLIESKYLKNSQLGILKFYYN